MTTSSDPAAGRALVRPNPFVGPQSLDVGQRIFGRDAEIDGLYYLLSAERIVLLHSPSGAGKSSLIRAGLMPRLLPRFDVWGPTRVNAAPGADADVNRYVRSANLGFEQGLPEKRRRSDEALSRMTLADYVAQRPRRRSAPRQLVLIFDQFEEILTADPLALDAKREFFRQLGELLQNADVWALFALREDYLAALDPYAYQMPTQLKVRFRLDLLGREAAQEAMVGTAAEGGRSFAADAVKQMAQDLATMQVQQPDGSFEKQVGPHVEPLHLQVACRGLWERMPADDLSIDLSDIVSFGDVDHALAGYYEGVVGSRPADERAARAWVGDELITPGGIRSQVLRGVGRSGGLDNDMIARLVDAHLVRGELRDGAVWYELAHDRLVEPVRTSNAAWFASHLQPLQRDAALWSRAGKPDRLLLRSEDLAKAEAWARSNSAALLPIEQDLLARSQQQRRALRLRQGMALGIVGLLVLGAAYYAWLQRQNADRERALAEERRVNIVALTHKVQSLEQAKAETLVAQQQQAAELVAQRAVNAQMKQQVATLEAQTKRAEALILGLRDGNRVLETSIARYTVEHEFLEKRIQALDADYRSAAEELERSRRSIKSLEPVPGVLATEVRDLSRQIETLSAREARLKQLVVQTLPCDWVEMIPPVPSISAVKAPFRLPDRQGLPSAAPVPADPADSARLRARIDELARELAAMMAERAKQANEADWLQKEAGLLNEQLALLTDEVARLKQVERALQRRQEALRAALALAQAESKSQLAWIDRQESRNAKVQTSVEEARKSRAEVERQTVGEAAELGRKRRTIVDLDARILDHVNRLQPIATGLSQAVLKVDDDALAALLTVKAYRWTPFDPDDADTPLIYNALWTALRRVDPAVALELVTPKPMASDKIATTKTPVMVEALCKRVGRPFSEDEWRRFMPQGACYTPDAAKVCER